MNFKSILYVMIFCLSSVGYKVNAQTGPATAPVDYELVYNTSTCLYEAHAIVQSGTLNFPFTIPFPSNFTIVIPTGMQMGAISATSFQPPALAWTNSNTVSSPAADPANDFHMFSISGGGGGNAYPTFTSGDDILLFTFSLPHSSCEDGARVFINGTDPDSGAPGMNGLDLSNSLKTLNPAFPQGSEQYTANINNSGVVLPKPTVVPSFTCDESQIFLTATPPDPYPACLTPFSYSWTGPMGFNSTEQNPIVTVTNSSEQMGTYSVTITDENGCTGTNSIFIDVTVCIALPVEFSSFSGKKSDDCSEVLLDWVVESEINNQGFEVQRSFTGVDFERVGYVESKGNTSSSTRYQYTDYLEKSEYNNDIYYKLKQIDFDGNFDYSKLINVVGNCRSMLEVTLSPNPARNTLYINLTGFEDEFTTIRLYDKTGKFIIDKTVETNSRYEFDVNYLVPGIYNVGVQNGDQFISKRFIKID